MPAFAFSVIKERGEDGSVKYYQPGDKLDGLDKERVAHLLDIGAASTYDRTKSTGDQVQDALAESESLKAKVADLEAKLADATKAKAASESKTESKPAGSSSASK